MIWRILLKDEGIVFGLHEKPPSSGDVEESGEARGHVGGDALGAVEESGGCAAVDVQGFGELVGVEVEGF